MRPATVPEPLAFLRAAPELMDLIVSTPQGEAEISVNAVHESVTVGDLLGRVLNSAPPSLVYIDGRPTPVGTLLSAAGLVTGTVIDISPPTERSQESDITLVQAAGEGGGNRRSLEPGRYSLGTARRANVAPLTFSQVLVPRCELVVEHSGIVTVTANQGDLDGQLATYPSRWEQQRLRIGHRVFRLDVDDPRSRRIVDRRHRWGSSTSCARRATRPLQNPSRTVATRNGNRRLRRGRSRAEQPHRRRSPRSTRRGLPSRPSSTTSGGPTSTWPRSIRRATQLSERLWERRPADDDAFIFSVGLADQPWAADDERAERSP